MEIKTLAPIENLQGEKILDENKNPITFRTIVTNLLLTPDPQKKEPGEEKYKRFKLAEKINENDSVDLNIEDLKLIKDLVGEHSPPLVVGKIYEILEKNN